MVKTRLLLSTSMVTVPRFQYMFTLPSSQPSVMKLLQMMKLPLTSTSMLSSLSFLSNILMRRPFSTSPHAFCCKPEHCSPTHAFYCISRPYPCFCTEAMRTVHVEVEIACVTILRWHGSHLSKLHVHSDTQARERKPTRCQLLRAASFRYEAGTADLSPAKRWKQ